MHIISNDGLLSYTCIIILLGMTYIANYLEQNLYLIALICPKKIDL